MATLDESPRHGDEITGIFGPRHRALAVGLVAIMTLVAFEYLAVATAMPKVAADLDGMGLYSLAFSGAMAAGVVATVVGGRWSDLRGPLAPLWTGVAVFLAGLVTAGAALNMEMLLAGRLFQGFGGGLFQVSLYVLVARVYPPALHPRVFSLFAVAWVLPSMIGPAVAGAVVDQVGWRWVFLGVALIAVPAALPTWWGLSRPDVVRSLAGGQGTPAPGLARRVGWAVLTAVGAALMQYGSGRRGAEMLIMVAGLALLAVALPRLLPRGTLRAARGLPTVVALRGLAAGAFISAEVMVPLMLMEARGLSTVAAGLALTGGAVTWSFGSWLQGRGVLPRLVLLRGGTALITVGVALMAVVIFEAVPVALAYVSWIIGGLGMGLVYPTLSVLALELSRPGEQGHNSSALQVGEQVFTVVVVAVTGALFTALESGFLYSFGVAALVALAAVAIAPRFAQPVVGGTMVKTEV
ncbi:Major Facilitator Superfamily protein [Sinosporangium album]|uniref:Major Facilitator Superfamily protein n=1 Tax=Sinosporangium album TaxID=504805 RepID=A0A1G7R6B8_9ACTN|nr:MFS transporter [Sinosporangium album]SDG06332.1 Major Facilitator Superfamily protein [Sinosporangium album]